MKLAVVGTRDFRNYGLMRSVLDSVCLQDEVVTIVSGRAKGADTLAEKYAEEHSIPIILFTPDWDQYGKRAAYIRNQKIVKNADKVVAFWNGESRGTEHTINLAREQGKGLLVVMYTKDMNGLWFDSKGC